MRYPETTKELLRVVPEDLLGELLDKGEVLSPRVIDEDSVGITV